MSNFRWVMNPLEDNFRQNLNSIRLWRLGSPNFRQLFFLNNFTVFGKIFSNLDSEILTDFGKIKNFGLKILDFINNQYFFNDVFEILFWKLAKWVASSPPTLSVWANQGTVCWKSIQLRPHHLSRVWIVSLIKRSSTVQVSPLKIRDHQTDRPIYIKNNIKAYSVTYKLHT